MEETGTKRHGRDSTEAGDGLKPIQPEIGQEERFAGFRCITW
jgi:hypothetical protein